MQSPASNNPPNRRQIVRGAAWSAPAVLSAGVVPAYASSKKGTATTTAGQYFRHVARKAITGTCNVTTNPTRGILIPSPTNRLQAIRIRIVTLQHLMGIGWREQPERLQTSPLNR